MPLSHNVIHLIRYDLSEVDFSWANIYNVETLTLYHLFLYCYLRVCNVFCLLFEGNRTIFQNQWQLVSISMHQRMFYLFLKYFNIYLTDWQSEVNAKKTFGFSHWLNINGTIRWFIPNTWSTFPYIHFVRYNLHIKSPDTTHGVLVEWEWVYCRYCNYIIMSACSKYAYKNNCSRQRCACYYTSNQLSPLG